MTTRPRIYIAGPMTGLPDFNYPAFHAAAGTLTAAGYEAVNPADTEKENTTGAPQSWSWYMRRALTLLLTADGVALLPGWDQSRGARIEEELAGRLGMGRADVPSWVAWAGQPAPLVRDRRAMWEAGLTMDEDREHTDADLAVLEQVRKEAGR